MNDKIRHDLEHDTAIIDTGESRDLISLRKYQLIVIGSDGNRRKYELGKQKTVKIGKKSDNDIVVNDKTISRYHAEILASHDNSYLLKDLNSTNGTTINGLKVKEAYL